VTVAGDGGESGGVYTPELLIVPTLAFPPAIPLTSQLTEVSVASPTEATKSTVPEPAITFGPFGVIETTVIGAEQAVLPALAGAVLVAPLEVSVTVSVSVRPAESVTRSVTVTGLPLLGAITVALLPVEPLTRFALGLLDHW